MRSIIQTDRDACYICKGRASEEHHCIYGTANRKLSEKYGLKVYLCPNCHRTSNRAVHTNYFIDTKIKQAAQQKFIEVYPDLDFLHIFGRNYLFEVKEEK